MLFRSEILDPCEECFQQEKEEIARAREELSLLRESVTANLALKLIKAEGERDDALQLADHRKMRLRKVREGIRVVDVEMKRLLQEGFDLCAEIDRLKSGKVARGVDKGTRMSVGAIGAGFCLAGV